MGLQAGFSLAPFLSRNFAEGQVQVGAIDKDKLRVDTNFAGPLLCCFIVAARSKQKEGESNKSKQKERENGSSHCVKDQWGLATGMSQIEDLARNVERTVGLISKVRNGHSHQGVFFYEMKKKKRADLTSRKI